MEEIKQKEGNVRRQIFTAILATVPTFMYGVQIGWLSPMGPLLKSATSPAQEPISDSDISWMAAALPLSAIVGIPFYSYGSDRYGRKICIIAVSLFYCISWILKLSKITVPGLIAARIIGGLSAGGCFVVVPVYVKEISEDSWRGALGSLNMTVCKLGVIFVYAVGMLASYSVNQSVYLTLSAVHVILFTYMPESPNFLLKIGKPEKAAKTVSWLRGVKRSSRVVEVELAKLHEEQRRFDETPVVTLKSIVTDKATFAALRVTLMLMVIQTLSGNFALMNYASDVFKRAGTHWRPNVLALFMGSLQLAGSFFTTMSIEKFGRKRPLACSCLVVCACMATVATCFLVNIQAIPWLPVVAVCLCILAYGAGLAPVPMVIMAEVFTFQVRARMAGAAMTVSFFCSSMTVLFFTPVSNQFGEYVVFFTFATVTLFGFIYTLLWVPETKGKSLQQIQSFWKKPEPVYV